MISLSRRARTVFARTFAQWLEKTYVKRESFNSISEQLIIVSRQWADTLTRAEKAEAERDGLAAALAMAERTINDAMASASVNNLSAAGGRLAGYQMCGRDYPAILLARDARITAEARRKALLEVGKLRPPVSGTMAGSLRESYMRGRNEVLEYYEHELTRMAQEADHA